MAERKIYHVVYNKIDEDWKVKLQKAERASGVFETKEEAVDYAKELAKDADLGQIKIHKKDGVIETEHTYGQDPKRYKG